jgi:hypothetical protein
MEISFPSIYFAILLLLKLRENVLLILHFKVSLKKLSKRV